MTQIVDISALHAALVYFVILVAIFFALSFRVVGYRRSNKIGIGDGGDKRLARLVRVHGNFVEAATFGIPAIFGVVLAGSPPWPVHAASLLLIAGRLAHAQGLGSSAGSSPGRAAGMVLTWIALIFACGTILWRVFAG